MELVQTELEVKLPAKEVLLLPISDLQYGVEGCDFDLFKETIEFGLKNNAVFLSLGDLTDLASPSNRRAVANAGLYDIVMDSLHDAAERALEDLKVVLAPTKGRWLGLIQGHHMWTFDDQSTTDTRLADFLGAPFLGDSAMIRLVFREKGQRLASDLVIFAAHGVGSGVSTAAPIAKLEKLAAHIQADLYLIGHHHKLVAAPISRLTFVPTRNGGGRLVAKPVYMACTGGYLKGYMQGSRKNNLPGASYVEKGLMPPVSLGGMSIRLTPTMKDGYALTDIKVTF